MSNPNNINQQISEIEKILAEIESGEITIEQAVEKYKQALELAKDLEVRLDEIKNEVEILKQQF